MKIKITSFAAVLLSASFVAGGVAVATENVVSKQLERDIQTSGGTTEENGSMHRLAVALSSGRAAMAALGVSQSHNNSNKDLLNPNIAGMECHIDRIASYISCYSALIGPEEAETLFTRLIDELQADLPSNRWKGIKKRPGVSSIRGYTYQDRESYAHIDIEIIARARPDGQSSHIVSFFGWPR